MKYDPDHVKLVRFVILPAANLFKQWKTFQSIYITEFYSLILKEIP